MKRSAILFVILIGLTMSGCLVSSLHPFYKMKDKIFDETLVGNWIDGDDALWIIQASEISDGNMGQKRIDSTYLIKYYEDKDAISYFQATLFVLNGQHYIDFFPDPYEDQFKSEMTGYHFVPVHTLARIKLKQDTMMLFWFGEQWLNELFENNRIRIDHEKVITSSQNESNVLTAETKDLQKFILKYMNDLKITQVIENSFTAYKEAEDQASEYGHMLLKLSRYNGKLPE